MRSFNNKNGSDKNSDCKKSAFLKFLNEFFCACSKKYKQKNNFKSR